MHRVQLVLKKDFPVVILDDAKAAIDDFYLCVRCSIAHVIERPAPVTKPFVKIWPGRRKTGKNKAAIGTDAGSAFHVGGGVTLTKPRILVTVWRGLRGQPAVKVELPGVIRAGKQATRIAFVFITEHGAAVRASIV